MYSSLRIAGVCLVAAMTAAAPAAAQEVGKVVLVHVYGYETPPAAEKEPIFARDAVVANTLLETVRDGRLDVRFVDDTRLIVGPSAQVRVDRFVFDPNQGAGEATLNMTKGVMRFITGRMASESYRVQTPTATLGVRGTDFVVLVDDDGSTTTYVLDGEVAMDAANDDADASSIGANSTGATNGVGVAVGPTVGLPPLSTVSFGADPSPSDVQAAENDVEEVEQEEHGGE